MLNIEKIYILYYIIYYRIEIIFTILACVDWLLIKIYNMLYVSYVWVAAYLNANAHIDVTYLKMSWKSGLLNQCLPMFLGGRSGCDEAVTYQSMLHCSGNNIVINCRCSISYKCVIYHYIYAHNSTPPPSMESCFFSHLCTCKNAVQLYAPL